MPTTPVMVIAIDDAPPEDDPGSHWTVVPDVHPSVAHVPELITRPVAVKSEEPNARPATVMMLLPVLGRFVIMGQAFVTTGAASSDKPDCSDWPDPNAKSVDSGSLRPRRSNAAQVLTHGFPQYAHRGAGLAGTLTNEPI